MLSLHHDLLNFKSMNTTFKEVGKYYIITLFITEFRRRTFQRLLLYKIRNNFSKIISTLHLLDQEHRPSPHRVDC